MQIEHETGASPAADPDVTPASSPETPVVATAAPAEDVKAEEAPSLLDVVKSAVVDPEEASAEDSSAPEPEKSEPAKEDEAAQAVDTDNFDGEPFGRHPRFKALLSERNTLRSEVGSLKGPAESYAKIETFLATNRISTEEMVDIFKFAALSKSDPEEALKLVTPLMTELYERTGRFLPDDIREDIEAGKIDESRGRELAQARAAKAESDRRAREAEEDREQVETSTQTERQRSALAATMTDWQAAIQAKDPDFAKKEEFIADRCRTLIAADGKPQTPEAMKALLDKAHADVTERMRNVVPARRETRPGPNGGSPPSSATVAPKTLLEAVTHAAAQAR